MSRTRFRIVFCFNDLLVGGAQKQFIEQLRHFDQERFEIVLVTLYDFGTREHLYDALPAHLEVYKLSLRGGRDFKGWLALFRLLKKLKPDVVVSSFFLANTVCRLFKPFVGYVSIAREHNTYIHKPVYQQWVDRLLAAFSFKIVAVSTTVRDFTAAQEHIPLEKFVVIHNGIDATHVTKKLAELPEKDMVRAQYGLASHDFVFINVARLTPQKNHGLLVEGFVEFSARHPECKLVIVGDGALREELELRAAKADTRIRFVGHQTDTWPFYKMADVFVSTSDIEGLSNSYLKALAAGLPLVSTKTAGTDEILHDGGNGFFIDTPTAHSVVETLEKVTHADLSRLRHGAEESVKAFDLRTTVKKYEELFVAAVS